MKRTMDVRGERRRAPPIRRTLELSRACYLQGAFQKSGCFDKLVWYCGARYRLPQWVTREQWINNEGRWEVVKTWVDFRSPMFEAEEQDNEASHNDRHA